MSKAFTRESDDEDEVPAIPRSVIPLPPGTKNYLTPEGERALRAELDRLILDKRPAAAGEPDAQERRRLLRSLDSRISYIQQSLESAVVVQPTPESDNQVRFGATVRLRDSKGSELCYRIVGIDEADIDRGYISWQSPIAKALLNAKVGTRVHFRLPSGEEEVEILGLE